MLRLTLGPAELAGTRFAMSPMVELFGLLSAAARPSGGTGRRGALLRLLHDRHMPLLAGFLRGDVWLPDFISPTPTRFAPTIEEELHEIATLAPARLLQEIAVFTTGFPAQGFPATKLSARVRGELDRGETEFAQKTARELHALWNQTLAPHWPAIRGRLEAEINVRSQLMAREGVGAVLGSLHPDATWHDTTLAIRSPFRATDPHAPAVIMIPTVTGRRLTPGLDPLSHHDTMLCYPVPTAQAARPAAPDSRPAARPAAPDSRPAAAVLGATRHRLLLALGRPLTTTELAERHHLDPSTVSYHLTRLHRAGLLARDRHGHRVYYRRTPQADRLLRSGQEP